MSSLADQLARARELAAKATPGPLKYDLHRPRTGFSLVTQTVHIADVMEANSHLPREEALANAEKLLRGWNTLPALLDVAEALLALRGEYVGVEDMLPYETSVHVQAIDAALARLEEVL